MKRDHSRTSLIRGIVSFCAVIGALAVAGAPASAAPLLEITDIRQGTTGNFRHSLFHSASSSNGESGSTLAYIGLDQSRTSIYNPNSGQMTLHANVYSDSGLQNQIAAVTATSAGFDFDSLSDNSFDSSVAGSLTFDFVFSDLNSALWAQLDAGNNAKSTNEAELTISFLDHRHTNGSHFANHFIPPSESGEADALLWGADGLVENAKFTSSTLGIDLALSFKSIHAPEPSTMAIWATLGIVGGVGGWRRRRRRAS